MRKLLSAIALLATCSIAHAESGSNQLFDCMDAKTFELNNQCISEQISNNVRFRDAQEKVVSVADESRGDYAIATMTFDQEKMQIDIVAHRDALQALAAVRQ
tara:strand:- start:144 stop:449 length:306 start_codon:yes stop_codon:yes gene_type:complete